MICLPISCFYWHYSQECSKGCACKKCVAIWENQWNKFWQTELEQHFCFTILAELHRTLHD